MNTIDPWGLDVYVVTRDVKNTGGFGTHSWTEVVDSQGKKTTCSGTDEKGNKLGVKLNSPPDFSPTKSNPETARTKVPPPAGMTQTQWDQAVLASMARKQLKDEARQYKLLGGDSGKTSGNCHVITSDVIEGAGGTVPKTFNPPGFTPKLRQ